MLQMPLKAGQHRPASETPFNSSLALIISGGPDPMSPLVIRAALDFDRVATVREKVLENEKFSRSGKSQGITFSVREI